MRFAYKVKGKHQTAFGNGSANWVKGLMLYRYYLGRHFYISFRHSQLWLYSCNNVYFFPCNICQELTPSANVWLLINNQWSLLCFCRYTWLILHYRRFNYSTRYIKCNENNVQEMKLNEPGGFLVSSLNSLGFRQQVKSKEIQREKNKKKTK